MSRSSSQLRCSSGTWTTTSSLGKVVRGRRPCPPSSTLLATTTAGSTFGQTRLRGTSPFPFATKETLLQFGDLGFEGLDLVRVLAQLDVFQPKFFLSRSHCKARLPGKEASAPNQMRSPENSLWSRCLRRNPVLVIHRIHIKAPFFKSTCRARAQFTLLCVLCDLSRLPGLTRTVPFVDLLWLIPLPVLWAP